MVILIWNWNHANLHGPRPLEGFCPICPPTIIEFGYQGDWNHPGTYLTQDTRTSFIDLILF
jgi:hypothetical protein